MSEKKITELTHALINLDSERVKYLLQSTLQKDSDLFNVDENILIESQKQLGILWEKGELALSQLYMAGKICNDVISEIFPSILKKKKSKVLIYTVVLEDFHVLGEKMLISILNMAGFSVIDYGYGISVNNLIESILRDKCEILMISTLMLHSALKVKQLKEKLNELHIKTKIIVGGAPFNIDPDLWERVGADATASTASKSIPILEKFLEGVEP